MTIDRLHLAELIEKGSDADLLREMMTFVVNRMMDLEVESLTGAGYGERSADRMNQRNGYRERPWHTTLGTLPVAIPRLRKGSYFPSFLEARRTSDKALIAVIQEAYVHGVSTRSVDDLAKAMGLAGISKSQVSRLCEEIDERVKTFLSRPIEGLWPYMWIDATYVKVREGGRIISVAVIIAVGPNADGRREVLGMEVGPSEAEPFWTKFLRSLSVAPFTSCAMRWPTSRSSSAAWLRLPSAPRLLRRRKKRRVRNGVQSLIGSASVSRESRRSWRRP